MKDALGTIIATIVMVGIVFLMFLSFSGGADYSGQQDYYDGSNRLIYP